MDWITRPATADDRAFALDLNRTSYERLVDERLGGWDDEWQTSYFGKKWAAGGYRVIESNGTRIGVLRLEENDDEIVLGEIQIVPRRRNLGLGTTIVRELQERAAGRGVPLRLRVVKGNRARLLYERLDFRVVEESETHCRMEWRGPADSGPKEGTP